MEAESKWEEEKRKCSEMREGVKQDKEREDGNLCNMNMIYGNSAE